MTYNILLLLCLLTYFFYAIYVFMVVLDAFNLHYTSFFSKILKVTRSGPSDIAATVYTDQSVHDVGHPQKK